MVNDNVVDVIVHPGKSVGEPALVATRPDTSFVQVDSQVRTVGGGNPHVESRAGGRGRIVVRGRIAVNSNAATRIYPVEDPTAYAGPVH